MASMDSLKLRLVKKMIYLLFFLTALSLGWMGAAVQRLCAGFSLWWLLLLQSTSSRACGLRDQTHVPCIIGRWILNHWTPRGVL